MAQIQATTQLVAVSFGCPTRLDSGALCGGGITDPETGSFTIFSGTPLKAGQVLTCEECGAQLAVPSVKGITA